MRHQSQPTTPQEYPLRLIRRQARPQSMSARTGHPQHQGVAGCVAGAGLEEEVEHPRIVRPVQLRNKQPDLILIVLDGGRHLPCTQAAPYIPSPPYMHVNRQ